jgi:predicted lipid-binding transport protein (Tim44 family)
MPVCPKCGTKVTEEMSFCPKCGAPLKMEQTTAPQAPPPPAQYRAEKREKEEKGEKSERDRREKAEKAEKHEKRQYGFMGQLIGGLILILFGLLAYLTVTNMFDWRYAWAFFIIVVGALIIIAAIYGMRFATRRYPRT